MKTKTYFAFRVDIWDDSGDSIVEHVAGVDDFEVAEATYRAAVARWPKARITLRQGARLLKTSRWFSNTHYSRSFCKCYANSPLAFAGGVGAAVDAGSLGQCSLLGWMSGSCHVGGDFYFLFQLRVHQAS
jgi:hypothetical protein